MIILLVAGTLSLIYGALIAFAGVKQMRRQEISTGGALLMSLTGALIMFAATLLVFRIWLAFYLLIAGLIAMHWLAIKNGIQMHGKLNPKHHVARLIVSLVIAGLALWGMIL